MRTGIIVPLYTDPGPLWEHVIQSKLTHPVVPMVLIANVDNGPGIRRSTNYAQYIERAQHAGIRVVGYVATGYGKRTAKDVEQQILRWYRFYYTDGVFFDEMAPDDAPYYRALTDYAHGHSLWFVVGNSGANASGSEGPDLINYYERAGYPTVAYMSAPAHRKFLKRTWSYIADDVTLNVARVMASKRYVGYLYATDRKEPECYCKLPTYFDQLVAKLAH